MNGQKLLLKNNDKSICHSFAYFFPYPTKYFAVKLFLLSSKFHKQKSKGFFSSAQNNKQTT